MTRWSENAVFTGGLAGIPGTPTKREPSAGEIAEGFRPGEQAPARVVNWLLNDLHRIAQDVGDAPAMNFSAVYQDGTNRAWSQLTAKQVVSIRDAVDNRPFLLALTETSGVYKCPGEGEDWVAFDLEARTESSAQFMIASKHRAMLVTPADGMVYVTEDARSSVGANMHLVADLSGYPGLAGGGYHEAHDRFFLGHENGILYSDDGGNNWTEAAGMGALPYVAIVSPEIGEADAGGLLALNVPDGAFDTVPRFSTDGGASWVVCATPSGHTGGWAAGAYNPVNATWYALNTTGKLYSSTDPLSAWTLVHTFTGSGAVTRKMAHISQSVVVCPHNVTEVETEGNVWVFPAVGDPLAFSVGDNGQAFSGVLRHDGRLALVRKSDGGTRIQAAYSSRSALAIRGGMGE